MGKIKKLKDVELVGGTGQNDVYPITSTKAIYDESNKRLDNIIAELQKSTDSNLQTTSKEIVGAINEVYNRGITYHEVPALTEDYMITSNPSLTNEVIYYITIGEAIHRVFGDSTIKWQDGKSPVSEANSVIVVSVLNNLAVWGIFK